MVELEARAATAKLNFLPTIFDWACTNQGERKRVSGYLRTSSFFAPLILFRRFFPRGLFCHRALFIHTASFSVHYPMYLNFVYTKKEIA